MPRARVNSGKGGLCVVSRRVVLDSPSRRSLLLACPRASERAVFPFFGGSGEARRGEARLLEKADGSPRGMAVLSS